VSEQLVRSKLEVQAGQAYNPTAVARDIRRLFAIGRFDTIKVEAVPEQDGLKLTYIFEEKRIIDEIKIIGNDKLRANKIRAVLSWKEGDAFAADAYDDERKALVKLYEEKGFANTSVDVNVEEVGPSRVRVTYAINEGKKARIRAISFEGNEALSSRALKKAMKTKRAFWFFGGRYNEAKFESDLNNIIEKYGDVGHLEAGIEGTNITYSKNGKGMDILIKVAEGSQYTVETLETAKNFVYDDDEILGIIKVHAGDVHNKGQVAKDAETIKKGYQDSGYVNAQVTPQVTLDREKKTTHVVQNVAEGDLKYIHEIDITGNSVTKDEVIRRQMLVEPGERYDGSGVKISQRRIENTHYFDDVRLTLRDVDASDLYTDLLVNVDEGKTGNFNFGFGYSTEEKLGGFAELKLTNFDITNWPSFSGGGQIFSTKLSLGSVRNQYNLSFTDPEFAGYPFSFGFDVFSESYRYTKSSNYTENTQGGQLRWGKSLSPYVSVNTSLGYTDVNYSDLASRWLYTEEWRRELESSTTVSNTWGIERNTLDNPRDPSTGSKHELIGTLAGLGGDNDFIRLEHDSNWYRPLDADKKWILSFRMREGWATAYGSSDFVPIANRFFAGGTSTVRGYDERDIGPKAQRFWMQSKKESIGGDFRLVDNLEVKYKLTEAFRLYAFVDSGGVWRDTSDFGFGDMKYSGGIGIGVDIPKMGPIRIDYGIPINPDKDQGSGRLHMMTGFRF